MFIVHQSVSLLDGDVLIYDGSKTSIFTCSDLVVTILGPMTSLLSTGVATLLEEMQNLS